MSLDPTAQLAATEELLRYAIETLQDIEREVEGRCEREYIRARAMRGEFLARRLAELRKPGKSQEGSS